MTKDYIQDNLLTSRGWLNPNKVKHINETNEQLYLIYNDMDIPMCGQCNTSHKKFISFTKGYATTCGKHDCAYSKSRTTTKEVKLERYGKNYVNIEKAKKTKLERYGDENYVNVELIKKVKLQRYGDKNYVNPDKANKTKLERYKNEYSSILDKRHTTNKEKYNTLSYMHVHITNILDMTCEYLEDNFIEDCKFLIDDAIEYFNVSRSYINKKKIEFNITQPNVNQKKGYAVENELIDLFSIDCVNDRTLIKPLEIDLLSHEHKFGIEYNGLLWHSYGCTYPSNVDSHITNKHLNKTELVESKGYQLFHIFEDEWLDPIKKDIWVSMINSKMGRSNSIGARKCVVKEVPLKEAREFCIVNHLQGYTKSSIRVGLYHENELVSLMTFGRPRMSKKYMYEILRMCNKKGTNIQGGFSKMLKYFERIHKPESLVSYANRRWSTGNVYEVNGFSFKHNSPPNMFWFNDTLELLHRQKFQKHKLKDIEGFDFDESLTAKENMFINGYRVIYDSGNKVYYK